MQFRDLSEESRNKILKDRRSSEFELDPDTFNVEKVKDSLGHFALEVGVEFKPGPVAEMTAKELHFRIGNANERFLETFVLVKHYGGRTFVKENNGKYYVQFQFAQFDEEKPNPSKR